MTGDSLVDQDDVISATASLYSDSFYLSELPYSLIGDGETAPGLGIAYSSDIGVVAFASLVSPDGRNSIRRINSDSGNV